MRILVVEDEQRLSSVIKKGLTEDGFAVDTAFDGEDGLYLAESETYDCIVLDIMLPKLDGLEVCRRLRNKKMRTPILMLTAKVTVEDKVAGLDSGADDYMTKPFAYLELRSRIHALLRRSTGEISPMLTLVDLSVDPIKHTVIRDGTKIILTPKEFSILELLMRHMDEVVTRTMITEHVWDYNFDGMSNVVDVFVASLRRKIDKKSPHKLIHTIHGVGYKISETA
ncbi:DNA-binding response regulator [Candidatus Gottesmanbacteria bacterium RBG_16_52_11]|uniref:DNA-binding response regulator n=1 Tax=Candidatus Gottesmanbacteria bacterium RBG_16_52_11 TaxID=1798374 RepID=A0A1F5YXD9_9BACT|nr:MAG: DNA-binding response regulator [Candidatus Gottesmanbacteria bacterium RBG_16_52_11]